MPFVFQRDDKSTERAVRRIAAERLETSRLLLDDTALDRAMLVHELRKNVKKLRALLRLVRPRFKGFARENAALRDAARLISDLRDADVIGASLDRVATGSGLAPDLVAGLRVRLAPAAASAFSPEGRLDVHREAIAAVEARVKDWKIGGKGFDALAEGLERSWDDARTRMRAALADPTGEALHEWRKRVKDHWYQTRMLAPIWPEMMQAHIAAADTLGATLGEARDLAFLHEALTGSAFAGDEAAVTLARIAANEERKLLQQAGSLGTRFFAEPATGLSRRWRGWWDIWASGGN